MPVFTGIDHDGAALACLNPGREMRGALLDVCHGDAFRRDARAGAQQLDDIGADDGTHRVPRESGLVYRDPVD